jgi:hypothetical protein
MAMRENLRLYSAIIALALGLVLAPTLPVVAHNNHYPTADVDPRGSDHFWYHLATVPGAPTSATATAGNAQATVSFTAPASNGGSVITGYTVTSYIRTSAVQTTPGSSSPITVKGLANGTSYTFMVTATNEIGTGPASGPSNSVTPVKSVTPATVPGAPTSATATADNAQATVSFTAPASNGGSVITGYTVTSNPEGQTASGPVSPIRVPGLTNGTAYTFTVTATNVIGTGLPSSPSNPVTPAATPGAPAFPLKISTDGRHLVDQNNVPFLIVGDAAWSLIAQLDDADAAYYLADRQSRGFNTIIVNLIEHKYATNAPADYYGNQPFTTPGDFSTPNDAYFAHVDWVISQAASYGILVILYVDYLGYNCDDEGWWQEMLNSGTTKCQAYGSYIGNRYKNFPNILWASGADVNPSTCGVTSEIQSVVKGIKSQDTNHLHTADCSSPNTAYDCFNYSWLNVNLVYYNTGCDSFAYYTNHGYTQVVKPLYFNEGKYEGEGATQQCLDIQAYTAVLGGTIGNVAGNNPIWCFNAPNCLSGHGGTWQNALGLQGSVNQANFGAFFQSIPWYNLVPDYSHTVLTSGYGNLSDSNYVPCARTNDGKYIVAYLPTRSTVTIDMSKISTSQVTARWFNPSTAQYTNIGTFSNTGTQPFTPNGSGDWVLLLTGTGS